MSRYTIERQSKANPWRWVELSAHDTKEDVERWIDEHWPQYRHTKLRVVGDRQMKPVKGDCVVWSGAR